MPEIPARSLSGEHIGSTIRAVIYPWRVRKIDKGRVREPRTTVIQQVYHSEDVILLNGGGTYLDPDGMVELIDPDPSGYIRIESDMLKEPTPEHLKYLAMLDAEDAACEDGTHD